VCVCVCVHVDCTWIAGACVVLVCLFVRVFEYASRVSEGGACVRVCLCAYVRH
jgi:hypothetical protein